MKITALSMIIFGLLIYCKPSSATSITFSGTVSSGIDGAGIFGGGSLVGDEITLSFTYDLSQTTVSTQSAANGAEAYEYMADGSGVISASVTIGGDAASAANNGQNGQVYYCSLHGDCDYDFAVSAYPSGTLGLIAITMTSGISATSLIDSTELANSFFKNPGGVSGEVEVCSLGFAKCDVLFYGDGTPVPDDGGTGGSPTPEPETWVLELAGIGGAVLAGRNRRESRK
jgi:hypothetical protein